jgi:hypothetical protein
VKCDTCTALNAATPTSATQHTCPKCYNNALQDATHRTCALDTERMGSRQRGEYEGARVMMPLLLMLLMLLLPLPPPPFLFLPVYSLPA